MSLELLLHINTIMGIIMQDKIRKCQQQDSGSLSANMLHNPISVFQIMLRALWGEDWREWGKTLMAVEDS